MGWTCGTYGSNINVHRVSAGKPERKPLTRPRRRWKHNSKMDLKETAWNNVDWIHQVQDRDKYRAVVNTVINTYTM